MTKYRIENRPAYVWRMHCWNQHAAHAWIPCWYVIDAETGAVVAGGHEDGANWRSGSATFSRKRDAQAWLAGYLLGLEGKGYVILRPGAVSPNWMYCRDYARKAWPKAGLCAADDAASAYYEGIYQGGCERERGQDT
jgi:hypothetical protein